MTGSEESDAKLSEPGAPGTPAHNRSRKVTHYATSRSSGRRCVGRSLPGATWSSLEHKMAILGDGSEWMHLLNDILQLLPRVESSSLLRRTNARHCAASAGSDVKAIGTG